MNDLLTHSHTDELSEADAALLFGGGPALEAPVPPPVAARAIAKEMGLPRV